MVAKKKTFQELRHHERLSVAENTAECDMSTSPPCRYEPCDSSSDSYSRAGNSGPESQVRLADLSPPPNTTVNLSFSCTCGHCDIMHTSR